MTRFDWSSYTTPDGRPVSELAEDELRDALCEAVETISEMRISLEMTDRLVADAMRGKTRGGA